mmetsp:Transcript_13126/g.43820  ORF Transcript_13126/g.43820 Transcript_13126/m.43820 type:complete len:298 (-) Transcript_13126:102-995(-)
MLTQPYEGRPGDVTIVPWAGHLSAISAVAKTLANPEQGADIAQVLDAGRKNTWRELAKIQSHTAVERALEAGVSDLRRRLVDQVVDEAHRNTSRAQDACKSGMGRTPSFYTSPSLLALSGLAVVDPVRPRPRTSSLDFTNLSKGRPRLGSVDQTQTAADASRRAAARAARGNTRDWPESSGSESPVGAAPRRLGEAAGTSSVKGRTSWAMPAPQEHAPWKRAPSPKGAPSQKEKSEKKKTSSSGHLDADARSFYKSSTMANFYYRDRACSTDDIRRNARPRLGPRGDSSEAEKAPSF